MESQQSWLVCQFLLLASLLLSLELGLLSEFKLLSVESEFLSLDSELLLLESQLLWLELNFCHLNLSFSDWYFSFRHWNLFCRWNLNFFHWNLRFVVVIQAFAVSSDIIMKPCMQEPVVGISVFAISIVWRFAEWLPRYFESDTSHVQDQFLTQISFYRHLIFLESEKRTNLKGDGDFRSTEVINYLKDFK